MGVAVNSTTNRVYVADYAYTPQNAVSVIDGSTNTLLTTISMGDNPFPSGVAVDEQTNSVYVGSHSGVSKIDGSTNTLVATQCCVYAFGDFIGLNVVLDRVYVTDFYDRVVGVNGSPFGLGNQFVVDYGPAGVVANPANGRLYVANNLSDTVTVLRDK
jgi:YVTN family beta-propeller protein